MGRPARKDIPIHEIARMRALGMGWKQISERTGLPKSTLRDRSTDIDRIEAQIRADMAEYGVQAVQGP